MKFFLTLTVLLGMGLCSVGCETSRTETDKEGILGGHKHEETTTTENPVTGTTSTSHTEQTTH